MRHEEVNCFGEVDEDFTRKSPGSCQEVAKVIVIQLRGHRGLYKRSLLRGIYVMRLVQQSWPRLFICGYDYGNEDMTRWPDMLLTSSFEPA